MANLAQNWRSLPSVTDYFTGMDQSTRVWICGATGRIGRKVAADLHRRGVPLVLTGKDRTSLEAMASTLGNPTVIVSDSIAKTTDALSQEGPVVVVNCIGPFTETALPIVRACAPGSHYVDLANDLDSTTALLELNDEAVAAGRCLVTGGGFG